MLDEHAVTGQLEQPGITPSDEPITPVPGSLKKTGEALKVVLDPKKAEDAPSVSIAPEGKPTEEVTASFSSEEFKTSLSCEDFFRHLENSGLTAFLSPALAVQLEELRSKHNYAPWLAKAFRDLLKQDERLKKIFCHQYDATHVTRSILNGALQVFQTHEGSLLLVFGRRVTHKEWTEGVSDDATQNQDIVGCGGCSMIRRGLLEGHGPIDYKTPHRPVGWIDLQRAKIEMSALKKVSAVDRVHGKAVPAPFAFHEDEGGIVMEHLCGVSARKLGALSPEAANRITLGTAFCLRKGHQGGVSHGDPSPNNVMVLDDGEIRVLDYGYAKDKNDRQELTVTGQLTGTMGWSTAYEVVNSDGRLRDEQNDMFGIGTLLCYLHLGHNKFKEKIDELSLEQQMDRKLILQKMLQARKEILEEARARGGKKLHDLIAPFLEVDPKKRISMDPAILALSREISGKKFAKAEDVPLDLARLHIGKPRDISIEEPFPLRSRFEFDDPKTSGASAVAARIHAVYPRQKSLLSRFGTKTIIGTIAGVAATIGAVLSYNRNGDQPMPVDTRKPHELIVREAEPRHPTQTMLTKEVYADGSEVAVLQLSVEEGGARAHLRRAVAFMVDGKCVGVTGFMENSGIPGIENGARGDYFSNGTDYSLLTSGLIHHRKDAETRAFHLFPNQSTLAVVNKSVSSKMFQDRDDDEPIHTLFSDISKSIKNKDDIEVRTINPSLLLTIKAWTKEKGLKGFMNDIGGYGKPPAKKKQLQKIGMASPQDSREALTRIAFQKYAQPGDVSLEPIFSKDIRRYPGKRA